MSALKKLILFVTVWAYALQASAGGFEAACPQHHGNHGEATQHTVAASVAMHSGHVAHLAGMHGSAASDADMNESADGVALAAAHSLADPLAADARCCDGDCRCDSHACSSPASGLSSTRDRWIIDSSRDVLSARAVTADLRGAHTFGLIRPPSIS